MPSTVKVAGKAIAFTVGDLLPIFVLIVVGLWLYSKLKNANLSPDFSWISDLFSSVSDSIKSAATPTPSPSSGEGTTYLTPEPDVPVQPATQEQIDQVQQEMNNFDLTSQANAAYYGDFPNGSQILDGVWDLKMF